jgi:CHASE2 domain-containing sensor protein
MSVRMLLPIPRPAAAASRSFFGLKYAAVLAGLLLARLGAAQEFPRRAPALDRLAQELFAEIQSDQVPYEDLYGTLLNYYQSPLNLNTASPEELRALPLLTEQQVAALLQHRQATGPLLSVYELQAVPGMCVPSPAWHPS